MTFKLIYTADLHGNQKFYERLLKKAEHEKCNAVAIGGDLCPRIGITTDEKIQNQRLFFEDFMIPLFSEFRQKNKNTEIYAIMGNDDFRINMPVLEDARGIVHSIHNKSMKLGDKAHIAGYSFVNITPFRLKDWEKDDFSGTRGPQQLFEGIITSTQMEKGTIKHDLDNLKKLSNPKETAYVIHAPPYNTKLDVIADGSHVGSHSVREFIEKEQPLLALHGHIHESPKMSGSWKDKIGNTVCINVGSSYPEDRLNCVIIDVEDLNNIEYFELA